MFRILPRHGSVFVVPLMASYATGNAENFAVSDVKLNNLRNVKRSCYLINSFGIAGRMAAREIIPSENAPVNSR